MRTLNFDGGIRAAALVSLKAGAILRGWRVDVRKLKSYCEQSIRLRKKGSVPILKVSTTSPVWQHDSPSNNVERSALLRLWNSLRS